MVIQNYMKLQESVNYQKRIKDYVISFCPTEFYGRNLHGQMRSGYINKDNKVLMFRIIQLPLTNAMQNFLETQLIYSDLSANTRIVYQSVESCSNKYVPMEFFPKTFSSQMQAFKENAKYFDQFVEKFLKVYIFFYNMKVTHGNLSQKNIGITFEGKVKLMDFYPISQNESFQSRTQKDFEEFKYFISKVLQKDSNYPSKFSCFNSIQTCNWQNLFCHWHITSPLEPLYLPRKRYIDNVVTLIQNLIKNLKSSKFSVDLMFSLRLLMLSYFQKSKQPEHNTERQKLQELLGKYDGIHVQRSNATLMGAIRDPQYYSLSMAQRLVLICCLIPSLNHQYLFYQIILEFEHQETKRDELLGDSLLLIYKNTIFTNLISK